MTSDTNKNEEKKIAAVIWDMDGVIADTGNYHFQAWRYTFHKKSVVFTEEAFIKRFGQRNDTIIRSTLGDGMAAAEVEAVANEKEADYRRRVAQNITALPGVRQMLELLRENGILSAIASSAPIENILLILGGLDMEKYFQVIVSGREVVEGKPHPQVYLMAAQKLGLTPQRCIVFEDAVAGVAGAKRARMKCLAVTNTHPRASLKEADLIVDSLETVNISKLEALFS